MVRRALALVAAVTRLGSCDRSSSEEGIVTVKQGPDHALYYADTEHIYRMG